MKRRTIRLLGALVCCVLALAFQVAEAQQSGGTGGSAGTDLTVKIAQAGASPATPTRTNVAFVITVSNVGAGQASNVLTRVSMPAAFTSLSTQPAPGTGITCSILGSTIECIAPSLDGNSQKTFRILTTAPSTILGTRQTFTLTAQVDPNNTVSEGTSGENNNSDNFDVIVVTRADLDINLLAAPGLDLTTQVAPDLVYVVNVDNDGDQAATNVLVRATLPEDVAFVGVEENTLGTCLQNSTAANGALNVNCTLPSLPAGANRHVRIIGRVLGYVPNGVQVLFAADVDPNNSVPERNENNNAAFMLTTLLTAGFDLQITGTQRLSTVWTRMVELDLQVKNNGPGLSPGTTVSIPWPTEFFAISFTDTPSCFDVCSIPPLAPGMVANVFVLAARQRGLLGLIPILVTHFLTATIVLNNPAEDTNNLNNAVEIIFSLTWLTN